MLYMLDTNICIYAIKHKPLTVIEALRSHALAGIGLSSVSAAELIFGATNSGSEKNLAALERFLAPLEIADFDIQAAHSYGHLRWELERTGQPIGPLDTQIAAHALSLDVILVTNNLREFNRVPGLRTENWAA